MQIMIILGVVGHEVRNYHISVNVNHHEVPWRLLNVTEANLLSIMQYFHNWTGNRWCF